MPSKIILPPSLKKGDLVGIVCPAGYMPAEKVKSAIKVISKEWGFKVRLGDTVGHQYNYFSGTDQERLDDLQLMLDDPSVRAVLCARGGYGVTRIIDGINFKKFKKDPKWIIGFSDITVLHSHIFSRYGIATLHAPMANAFNHQGYKTIFVKSLHRALTGKPAKYSCAPHLLNRMGKAEGVLVGGNLSLLAHLCGTRSQLPVKKKILFLEEVGEYLYSIDRMMYQLKRNGYFNQLAGLIIGGFTELKDTNPTFGKRVYDLIHDLVAEFDFPVCFGFPVSHNKENLALKIGGYYRFEVKKHSVKLVENE